MAMDSFNVDIKILDDAVKFSPKWPVQGIQTFVSTLMFLFIGNLKFMYVALINTSTKTSVRGCLYLLLALARSR